MDIIIITFIIIGMLSFRLLFMPLKQEESNTSTVIHEAEMLLESFSATNQVNGYYYYYLYYYWDAVFQTVIYAFEAGGVQHFYCHS